MDKKSAITSLSQNDANVYPLCREEGKGMEQEHNVLGTWQANADKTFYFLRGYAVAKHFHDMQKALIAARELHLGQKRKGGADYIVHPLRVCDYLVGLQIDDDILLSAALLHDVVEDNDCVRDDPRRLLSKYKLSQEVLEVVLRVTKTKGVLEEAYYNGIKDDWRALLIKLSDRCNNVSTLSCFTADKMSKYIEETRKYIMPLCSYGKRYYPEFSNPISVMKYHITAICSTVGAIIEQNELNNKGN